MRRLASLAAAISTLAAASPALALKMQPNVPPERVGECALSLAEWIDYAEDHHLPVEPIIRDAHTLFMTEIGAHGGDYGQRAYQANKRLRAEYQRIYDEDGVSAWGQRAADDTSKCAALMIDDS